MPYGTPGVGLDDVRRNNGQFHQLFRHRPQRVRRDNMLPHPDRAIQHGGDDVRQLLPRGRELGMAIPSSVLLNVLPALLVSGPGVLGGGEALRLRGVRLRGGPCVVADPDPRDHPGQLDVLDDLEDLGQGGPGVDGGPGMAVAQAGIGLHRLEHQEQQLFLPSREGPGRVSCPPPIPPFALKRLRDVLADDACPGGFREHRVPPSMPCSRTQAHRVASPRSPGAGRRVCLRSLMLAPRMRREP
jgi:hypothetical protein